MSLNTNIIPQTNLSHNHCDIYRKSADHLQYKVLLSKQTLASAEQFTDFINAKIQEFKLNPHKGEILKRNQKHEIEIQLTQSFAPDIHMPKIKI
jgi:hypothetical protein